jgi:hypothetical protein
MPGHKSGTNTVILGEDYWPAGGAVAQAVGVVSVPADVFSAKVSICW